MSTTVLQIVPRVAPSVCGVGDQSTVLATALRDENGIDTRFLVCDPAWQAAPSDFPFKCHALGGRSSKRLLAFLERHEADFDAIVVQYSGYGFAPRGAPLWLSYGLATWRKAHPNLKLVSMYHELFSSGPVTTSSFWLQPLQKQAIRVLARTSTGLRTNRKIYSNWLAANVAEARTGIIAMPVFSNFGESLPGSPGRHVKNQLVVQGLGRTGDLASSLRAIERLRDATGTESIKVLAPPPRVPLSSTLALEFTGHLPPNEATRLLRESRRGYMDYYPAHLAKSSIHAAFCAHGLPTYTTNQPDDAADGILHERQFIDVSRCRTLPGPEGENTLALEAQTWYQQHNISATARSYAEQLRSTC